MDADRNLTMPMPSKVLFTIVSVWQAIGAHLADFNPTHIFNPNWPPHAKFHTGQTLSMSIALAALAIYFTYKKTSDRTATVTTVCAFASLYWITQVTAIFYPGTDFADPDTINRPGQNVFGIPMQLVIDFVMLLLIATAASIALSKNEKWTQ